MISRELAQRFIENITRYTEYNVNIMDGDGIIIASRDPDRIGRYHEVAYRIIHGREDIVDTTDIREFPNVLPGINMVIDVDGVREGVVGVTGDPEEIRSVALIIKMSIESMLKYERQQEAARLRESQKERFIYMLTQVEHSDPDELRHMAKNLDYPEEMMRIPILIKVKEPSEVMHFLRNTSLHTRIDFSFVLDNDHLIVFKTMAVSKKSFFSNYKYEIGEYLSPLLQSLRQKSKKACFYVGSFQDTYPNYYYAFQHCKWLERHVNLESGSGSCFFYDHIGPYLQSRLPFGEFQHIFHFFAARIPEDKLRLYMQGMGALIRSNYNFQKAAKELYIHKNTLVYRYNCLKELMNMDPLNSNSDRVFLGAFYYFLSKNGFFNQ